jgi:hypothetical protein
MVSINSVFVDFSKSQRLILSLAYVLVRGSVLGSTFPSFSCLDQIHKVEPKTCERVHREKKDYKIQSDF